MKIGAAYYPELWPRERWEEDARLMRETGFNTVRLGEFSWSAIEPQPGQYDWDWLDEAIALFDKYGIGVVMSTPTPTPPKWLCDQFDIYQRDKEGHARGFGSRRHVCANNPDYLAASAQIARQVAARYGRKKGVIAWQLDNEYGVHDTIRCYCSHCREAFRSWLAQKYGTAEALNRAWGTAFWSQNYRDFSEIELPGYTPLSAECENPHNPSLELDFRRFSSDTFIRFAREQAAIVRSCSDLPITSNMMGLYDQVDYYKLAKELDFICWDNYPPVDTSRFGMYLTDLAHDAMCSVGNGSFWVMEQKSGPTGWNTVSKTPRPGQLGYWAEQAAAHGAEGIIYFNWRPPLSGTEMNWHGVLDHDGKAGGRRQAELTETSRRLQAVSPALEGSRILREAAIIRNYDNIWSSQLQPQNSGLCHLTLTYRYYTAFRRRDIHPAVVDLDGDLPEYPLALLPAQYLLEERHAEALENYVKGGGALLVTFLSGIKSWDNRMTDQTPPGLLAKLCGVEVQEFDSLPEGESVPLFLPDGPELKAESWCETLRIRDAEPIAYYAGEFYEAKPAAAVRHVGKGRVYYIGFSLGEEETFRLVDWIAGRENLHRPAVCRQAEVEMVVREKDGKRIYTLLNSSGQNRQALLRSGCVDLVSGEKLEGLIVLAPYEGRWIAEE